MYKPPFDVNPKIINLISEISEKIGYVNSLEITPESVRLRKKNRIKTIHSTLAIENNSLSLEQITALIDGKRVIGSNDEIQEVKNALKAYEALLTFNPYSQKDLMFAHSLMMHGLVDTCGKYRKDGVGIINGVNIIHIAPPPERVPTLMKELFSWLRLSSLHPLIRSSVFHYEFEFIHPFQDGNGRMGRLWQTVILKEWKEVFAYLPVESLIKANQKEYYSVLNRCDSRADSTEFIEFMLTLLLKAIEGIIKDENKSSKDLSKGDLNVIQNVTVKVTQKVTQNSTKRANQKLTQNQWKTIKGIKKNPHITQSELSEIVGITRKSIISNMNKLKEAGLIERIGPDKGGYWIIKN